MQTSPVTRTCQLIADHQLSGLSLSKIARQYGVNPGFLAYQEKRGADYVKPDLYAAILGESWHTAKVLWRGEPVAAAHVLAQFPPRQCPVTDGWFIPNHTGQKYWPGLSPAVKRAARRDLEKAREKFGEFGDWGKRACTK